MESERGNLVSPVSEILVVEVEIVTAIRELADRGCLNQDVATVDVGHAIRSRRRLLQRRSARPCRARSPRTPTSNKWFLSDRFVRLATTSASFTRT
jgi:hypothetical protein